MEPDVVYAVKPGEKNEALALSLRSLAHLPHHRVFIAGYCPSWVRGVTAIPVKRHANKFDSIEANVRAALLHPELAEEVVYMNDDFYFTRPMDRCPTLHGGPVSQYLGRQELKMRMRRTVDALHQSGRYELLAYDGVHAPLPFPREQARSALEVIPRGCLWRTWVGNSPCLGGEETSDLKVRDGASAPAALPPIVSTGRAGLHAIRELLEEVIPSDSPYVPASAAA